MAGTVDERGRVPYVHFKNVNEYKESGFHLHAPDTRYKNYVMGNVIIAIQFLVRID